VIGSILSRYELLDVLGDAEDAAWKARDLRHGRQVRLRVLPAGSGGDSRQGGEAAPLDRLRGLVHPNVCALDDSGVAEGHVYVAWAWADGETLEERLRRGPFGPEDAADLAAQTAAGLTAAHSRGIVHGSLEPACILLAEGGWVKVLDLGLAALTGAPAAGAGTSPWRPPEAPSLDPRSDVWSLGAVLAALLTGRPPRPDDVEPLPNARGAMELELSRILGRALAPRPEDRYPEMADLLLELQIAIGTGAAPRRAADPATRPRARQPEHRPEAARRPATATSRRPAGLVGRVVDHYEIREPLGGGGMGVVYKAEDTRLQRTVALKFLPPELTRDPVAKARFLQEARAASALDHPNICTIHEVGETDDGQLFLAMTCYDGETLKKRIEHGPLPIDEAVDAARQIAAGLAKAHRLGIVHRDIKPANIMLTGDGIVKILDFGLAKLAGAAGLTRAGFCLGTPAYMSPEQARGEVDHRTDLWSLGVVLYEMVTGAAPFSGESDQAIIYALLTNEPKPLRELRPDVPPDLERILGGMLAKDPGDRYPTVDAALADLKFLAGSTAGATMQSLALARRPRFPLWARIAAGAAGLVAIGAAAFLLLRPAPPLRLSFERLTDLEGRESYPSLSPDGINFLYAKTVPGAGGSDIYTQRVGGGNSMRLTEDSPYDDTQPAYSPDGQRIAFRSDREGGGIFLMGATGESVIRLTPSGYNPAWSPDGKEIVYATEGVIDPTRRSSRSELWRVEVESGKSRKVFDGDAVQPSWSPGGRRIAFWGLPAGTSRRAVWTIPADGLERGAEPVRVTPDDDFYYWNPVWSADGEHLFFVSNRGGSMTLWRVAINERTGRVRGEPEALTTPAQSSGFLSASRDGRHVVYATDESRSNFERIAFDPLSGEVRGDPEPATQGTRLVRSGDIAPDGSSVVYDTVGQQEDLFLVGAGGGPSRQLTDDLFKDRSPRWSPDGSSILFYSNRGGKYEAWSIRADGSGLRRAASVPDTDLFGPVPSPDGKRLACGLGFGAAAVLSLERPEADPEVLPMVADDQYFAVSSWSPDGLWLAGVAQLANGTSLPGVVIYSFAAGGYERLNDRGESPVWLPDSRRLVYLDGGRIFLLDSGSRRSRQLLAPPPGSTFRHAGMGPDGRHLYFVRSTDDGDIGLLTMN
jgi:serine/threonine protein kinase/Tol biopolymer transport system component